MHKVVYTVALIGALLPAAAQAQGSDADKNVANGGVKVAGWEARVDQPSQSVKNLQFFPAGTGLHVTTGPAAIFWNPSNLGRVGTKGYTVKATFTQTKKSTHPNAFGLIAGGSDLATDSVNYLYFIVRGDGKFMINHRFGKEVHPVTPWTEHAAVVKENASGSATNALAIVMGPEKISFTVNGTEVASKPSQGFTEPGALKSLSGIGGLRVNHNLDVHIEDFGVVANK